MSMVTHWLANAAGYSHVFGHQTFRSGVKQPTPPQVPNPNDAANAAQAQTDAMRERRGIMANIYAGNTNQAPVAGKTELG